MQENFQESVDNVGGEEVSETLESNIIQYHGPYRADNVGFGCCGIFSNIIYYF